MQQYQVRHQTVSINNFVYPLRTLQDRQQFHDKNEQAAAIGISSATWSLFGVVWPSSRILATHVSGIDLSGKRVLEIGCGIALSSIVLHRLGVDITASDYHPLAREFLDRNVLDNLLPPIKFQNGNWEIDNPLLARFDVIIGSDVLYQPAHPAHVSDFIERHCLPTANVIIVDPDRGNRARFTKAMLSLGFSHSFERFNEEEEGEEPCKGRILSYSRQDFADA
ncbi:MAG: methyltransferase domain-containing protein [Pseudomonadota bacterium]